MLHFLVRQLLVLVIVVYFIILNWLDEFLGQVFIKFPVDLFKLSIEVFSGHLLRPFISDQIFDIICLQDFIVSLVDWETWFEFYV